MFEISYKITEDGADKDLTEQCVKRIFHLNAISALLRWCNPPDDISSYDVGEVVKEIGELFDKILSDLLWDVDALNTIKEKHDNLNKQSQRLKSETGVWEAFRLVVTENVEPDKALHLVESRGFENLPSLADFQKMLRQYGLSPKKRRN